MRVVKLKRSTGIHETDFRSHTILIYKHLFRGLVSFWFLKFHFLEDVSCHTLPCQRCFILDNIQLLIPVEMALLRGSHWFYSTSVQRLDGRTERSLLECQLSVWNSLKSENSSEPTCTCFIISWKWCLFHYGFLRCSKNKNGFERFRGFEEF